MTGILGKINIEHKVLEGGINAFYTDVGANSADYDIVTAWNDLLPQMFYLKTNNKESEQ